MAARPRIRKRAHFPPNLHEPRPGYFTWRDPRDGKTHVIGRVSTAEAIHEALQANLVVERGAAKRTLADRVAAGRETVKDLLGSMPTEDLAATTKKKRKSMDKTICESIGQIECSALTVRDIAKMLEAISEGGQPGWARDIRNRLIAACAKAITRGWMENNPAAITELPKVVVKRQRLTLESFQAILAKAPEINPWLENAMLLAVVSGQDRSVISTWTRRHVKGDVISAKRAKVRRYQIEVEIPTALRLDVLGLTLADVILRCKSTGVASQYLIHHLTPQGQARRGDPVKADTISEAFRDARRKADIPDEGAPTFHEIRSLAKRLYDTQGGVDTKALLGHTTDATAKLYANARGAEPIRVKIGGNNG